MKVFSSIKNSGKLIIRYFLKIVYLCNIIKENYSKDRCRNPATSDTELFVICDISEQVMTYFYNKFHLRCGQSSPGSRPGFNSASETVCLKSIWNQKVQSTLTFKTGFFNVLRVFFLLSYTAHKTSAQFYLQMKLLCTKSILFKSETILILC